MTDKGKITSWPLLLHALQKLHFQVEITLYCRTCKTYFSERKGSALWHSRLPEEKAGSVLEHIADGCGVRQTARLVKVHRDTVCRLNRQAGDHAARTHDEVVSVSPPHRRDPV